LEQRVDLGRGEVGEECLIVVLRGDRQDPGDEVGVLGVAQRGVTVEGVDRGQASVAGADAVPAALLERREERGDQLGVENADVQVAGLDAGAFMDVVQEQPQGVAVGGDRVLARAALGDQELVKND
jgi:hypothetical protein